MQLEVPRERDVADMKLQPDPWRTAAAASGGKNAARSRGRLGDAGLRAQFAARVYKRTRESRVQNMPAQSQRGGGQPLHARRPVVEKPGDLAVSQCVRQKRREPQAGDGPARETGDEFAAH